MVDQTKSARFAAEKYIGAHIEVIAQIELLMDKRDPIPQRGPHGVELGGLSLNEDLPAVRPEHSCENLHECALPRPVFAYHGQHLPAPDGETYVAERDHAGEAFVDLPYLEQIGLRFAQKLSGNKNAGLQRFTFRLRAAIGWQTIRPKAAKQFPAVAAANDVAR